MHSPVYSQEAATRLYFRCWTPDPNITAADKIACWKEHLFWRPNEIVPRVFEMQNWKPKEFKEFKMVPYFFPSSKFLMCFSVEGLGNFRGFGMCTLISFACVLDLFER